MPLLSGRNSPMQRLLALDTPLDTGPAAPPRKKRTFQMPQEPVAPVAPEAEPWSTSDYVATGVRGLGGLLGVGAWPGAGFGAGSEALATLIEGENPLDTQNMKDIAAAGAVGAAGGGIAKIAGLAAGPLQAALKGGLLAGAAPVAAAAIRGEELPSFGDVATSAVLGGGVAGGTNALLRKLGAIKTADPTALQPPKPTMATKSATSFQPGDLTPPAVTRPAPGAPSWGSWKPTPAPAAPSAAEAVAPNVPELRHAAKAERDAWGLMQKEKDAAAAAARIAQEMGGRVAGEPSISQSISTPIAGGGTRRMSTTFKTPDEDEAGGLLEAGGLAKALGMAQAPRTPPVVHAPSSLLPDDAAAPALPQSLASLLRVVEPAGGAVPPGLVGQGMRPQAPRAPRTPRALQVEQAPEDVVVNTYKSNPFGGNGPELTPEELAGAVPASPTFLTKHGERWNPADEAARAEFVERRFGSTPVDAERRMDWRQAPPDVEARINAAQGRGPAIAEPSVNDVIGALRETAAPMPRDAGAAAPAAPSMSEITKLFGLLGQTPMGTAGEAAGANYRQMKDLFARGATGMSPEAEAAFGRTVLNKGVGRRASDLARAEGLAPGPPTQAPAAVPLAEAPAVPAAAPARGGLLGRLMGEGSGAPAPVDNPQLAALRQRYEAIQNPAARERFTAGLPLEDFQALQTALGTRPGFRSEIGGIDPTLLARLGLGAAGAAVGGAMDPLDNELASALVGGAFGAALPSIATQMSKIGPLLESNPQATPDVKSWAQTLTTPEGIVQNLKDLANTLPSVMRGNLLASENIIGNAGVGPWTSGVHFALERIAMGDPDGWRVLSDMHPVKWAQRYRQHLGEAQKLVGEWERAGGPLVGEAGTMIEKVAAVPGTLMAGGDLATRIPIAERFGEETARRATLTGEPELAPVAGIINYQRSGGPVAQMLLPFARTLGNLVEEGLHRTPVLGSLTQQFRPKADPADLQLIKQLFGGASAGGGYLAGQQMDNIVSMLPGDDTQNKRFLRNILSNAAGPNAVLANAGLAAGMASDAGRTPTQQVGLGLRAGIEDMPLPSTDPLTSMLQPLTSEPGKEQIPGGILPQFLRNMLNRELAERGEGSTSSARARSRNRNQSRTER